MTDSRIVNLTRNDLRIAQASTINYPRTILAKSSNPFDLRFLFRICYLNKFVAGTKDGNVVPLIFKLHFCSK